MLDTILLLKQCWTNINQNLISVSYLHRSHLTNSSDSYDADQGRESTIILFIFSKSGCSIYYTGNRLHMNSLQQDWQQNSTTDANLTLACIWHVFHFSRTAPWASCLPSDELTSRFTMFSQLPKVILKKKVTFRDALRRTTDVLEMVIKGFIHLYLTRQ